jgi:pyrroline-5-carboxylate reductase
LGGNIPIIRVMPNTPALVRAGAIVYCAGRSVKPAHEETARRILASVGKAWKVDEVHMDAVTALSGSGPAYVFYLVEAMSAAGAALGLPAELAEALARQTVYGSGLLLKESRDGAEELRRRVTSPGGTTEAAVRVLEEAGTRGIFERALSAASRRSRELSERR